MANPFAMGKSCVDGNGHGCNDSGFVSAGVDMTSGRAPEELPDGVIGLVGYVNRLLIVVYCY
jgi:hypothetical protein